MKEAATNSPQVSAEEDRGELRSLAHADEVRSVLSQGWSRSDVHMSAPANGNGALRSCRWQQQVRSTTASRRRAELVPGLIEGVEPCCSDIGLTPTTSNTRT